MKRLLPFLLLASCAQFEGTDPKTGAHYKGTLVMTDATAISIGPRGMKAAGLVQSTVPNKLIETAGVAYGVGALAAVQKAANAGDVAIATGAQKAGVASQKIAADEAVALGAQGVTKAITIPK